MFRNVKVYRRTAASTHAIHGGSSYRTDARTGGRGGREALRDIIERDESVSHRREERSNFESESQEPHQAHHYGGFSLKIGSKQLASVRIKLHRCGDNCQRLRRVAEGGVGIWTGVNGGSRGGVFLSSAPS